MAIVRPTDILEEQARLIDWWNSQTGHKFAKGFINAARSTEHHKTLFPAGVDSDNWVDHERDRLRRSTAYLVASDMLELCWHASQSMKPQPLKYADLPSPRGFMWLEKSIYMDDIRGKKTGIGAICWGPAKLRMGEYEFEGLEITLYSHKYDNSDYTLLEMKDSPEQYRQMFPGAILLHMHPWAFDTEWESEFPLSYLGNQMMQPNVGQRLLMAIWTIMQQKIVQSYVERPVRQMRRRLERDAQLEVPEIKVVALRKVIRPVRERDDLEPVAVDWSHRWMVDGHWRWQYYPSLGYNRQIWINPHIRGPEDKPLIIKDRVYHFKQ